MIVYADSLFGFYLIFRVHGSAVWKACVPALTSTTAMLLYDIISRREDILEVDNTGPFLHPYPITAFVAFFSFLLTFRLNYAYQRYWSGATAVHAMLSKWLDVATYMAAFHYQSKIYDTYRPPTFGEHNNLRNLTRERERERVMTQAETVEAMRASLEAKQREEKRNRKQWWMLLPGAKQHRASMHDANLPGQKNPTLSKPKQHKGKDISGAKEVDRVRFKTPRSFHKQFDISANPSEKGARYSMRKIQSEKATGIRSTEPVHIPYPSLFLQETAHLVSLLAGVALSTLRNDIEGAPSPLAEYFPGQPMPPVDPDELSKDVREQWNSGHKTISAIYFLLGLSRSDRYRALYNYNRPFQILGGVSDAEIDRLQRAHGPYAKVALCSMYVQEFIAREYLNGSTGKVPAPLISRITHVLSDGMTGYNEARHLSYNPFPFPHAQMTTFFTTVVLFIFPLLSYCYVNDLAFACTMNFVTVLCFLGIHEVARELERPMHNVPNDLPLTTFQAQFNEALITIYSGFHPDSWWEVDADTTSKSKFTEEEKVDVHPLKR